MILMFRKDNTPPPPPKACEFVNGFSFCSFRHGFQFAYLGSIDKMKLENFALGGYRDVRKEAVTKPISTL